TRADTESSQLPSPSLHDALPIPPGAEKLVMHAYLVHPGFTLMAGDTPAGMSYEGIKGAMMAITFPDPAEAERIFKALSQGGNVRSEEHTSELQSRENLVCRLLLE